RRMDMADGLDIGTSFINARVNPKFGIGPAIARQLLAIDVENQQIVLAHQGRAHARRKDKFVRARNARAHMAEGGGDALLMQNVTGSDDVLFELSDVHLTDFPLGIRASFLMLWE